MHMIEPFAFLVAALAVYRLSRMVAEEEGPGAIFTKLRGAFDPDQQTWVGRGLNCPICVSFWVALPAAIAITVLGYADVYAWPLTWLALSAGTVVIKKWEHKK
jgi:hypothetical protein